jgi:hydroxymethylpyrimidine/phosphomethylpyrimidine kinase
MKIAKALTIAGSDSGGGAGIQADLKTFAALGVYGCSVITAVTAQNTCDVIGIEALSTQIVRKQLEAVLSDIRPQAVKTGMLVNRAIIRTVARTLQRFPRAPLVVDPVMVAKSGDTLLAAAAIDVLRELLIPLAEVVTPNIPEAETLTDKTLRTEEDFIWAAKKILEMGPKAVLLKGGHRPQLRTAKASSSPEIVDILCERGSIQTLTAPWVGTPHTHGTGCTLASAIAAGLAKGMQLRPAIVAARQYLTEALQTAFPVGQGKGPVHHFHPLWKKL